MDINGITVASVERFNKYAEWLARQMVAGVPLASHACPHCGSTLHVIANGDKGDQWDSTCACPVCAKMFHRSIIHGEGAPAINIIKLDRGW